MLDFNKLGFKLANPQNNYYECPVCHRIHLNKGFGFCTNTNCMKDLKEGGLVGDLRKNHFIAFDIFEEKKTPRRLHTEELTGQTDNIQERLLEFKDLIFVEDERFRKGYELTKSIDMVNVTTTMEVGVDIGSLEAIFQGNMSPTRYNYQQRVGRGGRRGQAFSAAVTFCRGRSHDVYYYYKATEDMIGSVPVAPKLSLAPFKDGDRDKMKLAIIKRVIAKSLFREALSDLPYNKDLVDTAGEFGTVEEWKDNKPKVEKWLKDNGKRVEEIINLYLSQFNRNGRDISSSISEIRKWIIEGTMLTEVDNAIGKCGNPTLGLAQCMAEAGLLPMYGLPSDLRQFYHGTTQDDVKSIDRSVEMSITEFAPGSEKTKDKGKYQVDGLTLPMKYARENPRLKFLIEGGDALADRYTISFDKEVEYGDSDLSITNIECAVGNGSAEDLVGAYSGNQKMVVIPRAYRSYKITGNRGKSMDNNERRSAFSQSIIFAKDNSQNAATSNTKTVGNATISAYGLGLNEDAEVWHINTNNNWFFNGKYSRTMLPKSRNDPNNQTQQNGNFMFFNENGERVSDGIDIALGAKKSTEMVKIEINGWKECLDLNLNTGNSAAIRAAFFSAAFLIQRTLADKLDVQPDEIEISEKLQDGKCIIYLNDALPNGAGLVSYLYEGDNFKELLKDIKDRKPAFIKALYAEDHAQKCLTACQKCLKTYTNRGFHHVLDWRLGMGIISLMLDQNYDFGFSKFNQECEDKDDKAILTACATKLNKQEVKWCYSRLGEVSIIYHPLWNRKRVVRAVHGTIQQGTSVKMYNSFNLLRSNITTDAVPEEQTHADQATQNAPAANNRDQQTGITPGVALSE